MTNTAQLTMYVKNDSEQTCKIEDSELKSQDYRRSPKSKPYFITQKFNTAYKPDPLRRPGWPDLFLGSSMKFTENYVPSNKMTLSQPVLRQGNREWGKGY